jgi:hypothetical protein
MYEVSSMSSQIMMEWSNHILDMLTNWPEEKPIQVLYNLSRPKISIPYLIMTNNDIFNIGITQFGKAKAQQILIERGDLFGRLALLVPASSSGMLLRMQASARDAAIDSRLFYNYSKAIEWLTDTDIIARDYIQTRTFNMDRDTFQKVMLQDEPVPSKSVSKRFGLFYNHNTMIVEIPLNQPLVIGRHNFDLQLVGDDSFAVSRLHAQIDTLDSDFYITDLTSTNGTFINGKRIEARTRIKIEVGAEIRLGYTVLRLDYIND